MKIELSIKDDKELRNLIKDMIKGQVKSVLKKELTELTIEAFKNERIKNIINRIDKKLNDYEDEMDEQIKFKKKEIREKFSKRKIDSTVSIEIQKHLKKYNLDDVIISEIKSVVANITKKQFKNFME